MKLSVVIGTYNQKEKLKKVLDSLLNQTLSKDLYEIIVVDSSSTDGTEQMIKELKIKGVRYIKQENLGRPGARNRGINEAEGEIVFLTDADMLADPKLLEEHLKAHEAKTHSSFEGLTINPDGNPYIKKEFKDGQKLKWAYFLTGNLSISKNIIQKSGMFDMAFTGYGWEDIELGYRLSKIKIPLFYLPSAINHHLHPITQEDMLKRKYNMGMSAKIFLNKHPNFEIKMFLGFNPIAYGIYFLIKRIYPLKKIIEAKSKTSRFFQYLWEEFLYRQGFEENIKN
ncbi:hypothetical protein A2526_06160 [candidate division WOR-1 bacterium RIFOXYD2_FULL_36_8]|uniref:Glycosyltransferase 2-like domain-containing protein n=1 Tax=candidate division WOR-1 bacterium RIFOXYB2_FULL_36_35 TaxID=1802578 RepID=A0A1F4SAB7_UNCSA|nr:MAG: hypothetical protein A2230_08465 [candidate division WOR-1 bacterium RIFOXYA2_FULL_36_21]OGC15341.1 MAG: hypothetical protein A2282_06215 [candidate division WOR-1 bacterium RIFOXYA12_FULL_36_13]OGC16683.1 MAG: hypothetical protein A2290_03680 [candidate division WOR-1 bacterium RIFOXYB2_FULL_36_35]OGC38532.1 MAG: hypothetical protein A2526_06160 [candidate division WOR-1 bacterium RIFOXYD2_FULL_36_8]